MIIGGLAFYLFNHVLIQLLPGDVLVGIKPVEILQRLISGITENINAQENTRNLYECIYYYEVCDRTDGKSPGS